MGIQNNYQQRKPVKTRFYCGACCTNAFSYSNHFTAWFWLRIIDDSGNVQLHSDMSRNLQENIIEKMFPVKAGERSYQQQASRLL